MDEEAPVEVESKNTKKRKNPPKNTTKNKRKGKKWSKLWIDFKEQDLKEGETIEDVKAKCLHCGKMFLCNSTTHGIKNLKRHLLRCELYKAKQSNGQTQIMFEHGDGNKMMAWKFDQKESKKALAHMVIVDELPFCFVEREGFRHYSKINQPLFDVPCRGTTTQDCYKLYDDEKNKLLNVIQKNIGRVCLTTDSWTSVQKKSYMALTGHFIDNEWKLKKKVLNFCRLDGHSGVDIGKGVESCVNEWGINAILAISVDNAMQDGTKVVDKSIENIRYAVKWIKKSGSRIEKFKSCAESAKCDITKNLILDVPTRWNSTYNMLEVAQAYEDAFDRYDLEDVTFGNAIRKKGLSVPTSEDWDKARKLCGFLKMFYDVTLRISGTKYVTSHTLVVELSTIRELLRKQMMCDVLNLPLEDENLYNIAKIQELKIEFLHIVVDDHRKRKTSDGKLQIDEYDNKSPARIANLVSTESGVLGFFSTSGRVLDTFRSSLSDKSIESLICTQDWLRKDNDRIPEKEEDCEAIINELKDEVSALKRYVQWS
ncbi:zinc finger BED domain-containing protein RICESLEEPER 2-like protein [Tanacetum coccineum]